VASRLPQHDNGQNNTGRNKRKLKKRGDGTRARLMSRQALINLGGIEPFSTFDRGSSPKNHRIIIPQ